MQFPHLARAIKAAAYWSYDEGDGLSTAQDTAMSILARALDPSASWHRDLEPNDAADMSEDDPALDAEVELVVGLLDTMRGVRERDAMVDALRQRARDIGATT
jgi:hypothetical protein